MTPVTPVANHLDVNVDLSETVEQQGSWKDWTVQILRTSVSNRIQIPFISGCTRLWRSWVKPYEIKKVQLSRDTNRAERSADLDLQIQWDSPQGGFGGSIPMHLRHITYLYFQHRLFDPATCGEIAIFQILASSCIQPRSTSRPSSTTSSSAMSGYLKVSCRLIPVLSVDKPQIKVVRPNYPPRDLTQWWNSWLRSILEKSGLFHLSALRYSHAQTTFISGGK